METSITTYGPEPGILRLKWRGRFGVGSEGEPSSELLAGTIEGWLANHAAERVEEIEVDYTDVDYSSGDGPVSSIIPFVRRGVMPFRLLPSSSNCDALKGLLGSRNLPFFELSFNGVTEGRLDSARSRHFREELARTPLTSVSRTPVGTLRSSVQSSISTKSACGTSR
jgi:hypothetical protein